MTGRADHTVKWPPLDTSLPKRHKKGTNTTMVFILKELITNAFVSIC